MGRKSLLIAAAVLVLSAGIALFTGNVLRAENDGSGVVLSKLDAIIDGQNAIRQDIASMKEELKIIKIRITQQQ